MNINPMQNNQQNLYMNPNVLVAQNEDHPNHRMAHVQDSGEIDEEQCQTCMNRRYVDVSDDPGVSFQAPTRLTPAQAAQAVPSHEREHYNREAARAEREDRDVIHNSIKIFTSVCPECGISYISGGETTTVTRGRPEEDNQYHNHREAQEGPREPIQPGELDLMA